MVVGTAVSLAELYAERCATPSDIYLHLPRMVDLVTELDAKHVIELGTRSGVSTIAWLYGLSQTGGRLTSVDLDTKPDIGDFDHWTFVQGDDTDPVVVSALAPADIVFIDSSHLYAHTVQELNIYRWLVKPGGVICMHDTELQRPETAGPFEPPFPVRKALLEFVADTRYEHINYPECYGFAVVKVGWR